MSTWKQGMYNTGSEARTMGMSELWYRTALLRLVVQAGSGSFAAWRDRNECILCGCRNCFSNPLDSRKTRVALRCGAEQGPFNIACRFAFGNSPQGSRSGTMPLNPGGASASPYSTFASRFRLAAKSPLGTHSQQMPRKGQSALNPFFPGGPGAR